MYAYICPYWKLCPPCPRYAQASLSKTAIKKKQTKYMQQEHLRCQQKCEAGDLSGSSTKPNVIEITINDQRHMMPTS